ncbi:MAG: hypothetical protein A2566_01040 [Candidatus Zambryskibacteria bacterium RIFOXYD1_FULL_40_13]|nr:MAG: hypothetical protein A2123_00805 [Candidatus Zambryskibacteria bacterium GWB1_40_5]OHB16129.1 MAG: hypothetical protein A2566_01040 [Candidatus Zambryskibacteria bacterium RIFOXYD1_FULL_40_13]HBD24879.1 hypothetical protein [Candidatus Zambryskibacteria bacterium]HBO17752.1 hypothetical protein [Candidatus Zambryskibacteria bacterium]HBZ04450.1 hypothetical protein [Candidatus Zambryskibacteria bacterium]
MSIKDLWRKSNPVVDFGIAPSEQTVSDAKIHYRVKSFYVLFVIILTGIIFFALGRLSALEEHHEPIKIEYVANVQTGAVLQSLSQNVAQISPNSTVNNGEVIGSKNGKKYYFPWCGTVKMIKPENQIKFASTEEARNAGYLPASNCKGLK